MTGDSRQPDASAYTDSLPEGTEAGTYYVWYMVKGGRNYNDLYVKEPVIASIGKAVPGDVKVPEALELTYTGEAQELVSAGEAQDAVMEYALGTNAKTAPKEGWSKDIPKAANAGTYYVWYRVQTDKDHEDTAPACVTAAIQKAPSSAASPVARKLVYSGKAQALVDAGTAEGGTLVYAVTGDSTVMPEEAAYTKALPKGTEAGTYFVWYKVKGDANHLDTAPACIIATIKGGYSVTFMDEDGLIQLMETREYAAGTPAADIVRPADPTKEENDGYTYTFAGWVPEITDVTGDIVYTASFTKAPKTYTLTYAYEGEVPEGAAEQLPGPERHAYGEELDQKAVPSVEGYTFSGWLNEPDVMPAADVRVIGRWIEGEGIAYKVEHYRQDLEDPGHFTLKETDNLFGAAEETVMAYPEFYPGFTLDESTSEMSAEIAEGLVLKLYYVRNYYDIRFLDYDGTLLSDLMFYPYETPAADIERPADPVREGDSQYTYTFAGWAPEITDVTDDAVYRAVYTASEAPEPEPEPVVYTVTFLDEDGTVLLEPAEYAEGTPAADIVRPADPTKAADQQYTYTFAGWTPEITDVTGDAVYTATYSAVLNQYTITFDPSGGRFRDGSTEPLEMRCEYGATIQVIEAPERDGYRFLYWEGSEYYPGDAYEVTGDHTLTAKWGALSPEPDDDMTPDDDVTPDQKDDSKPNADGKTKTGDENDLLLWVLLLGGSVLIIGGSAFVYRKRKG